MSDQNDPDSSISAYVGAAAELLMLPIAARYRPDVELQFARIAALARLVAEHRLDITDEPATLYDPGKRV